MFQIRAEQYAAMRRKKLGDAVIQGAAPLGLTGRWDAEGVAILLEDALKNRSRIGFDRLGFIDRFTSPLGRTWQLNNLPDGKLAQLTSPSGHAVGMAYGERGLLATVGSTDKQPVHLRYTVQGQLAETAYADGTRESVDYTPWNAPGRLADRMGAETICNYDKYRRLTAITDGNGNTTRFDYSVWNRPDAVHFPNGTSEFYFYDEGGRLARIVQGDVTVDVTMNDQGKPLSLRYSDDVEVAHEYDDQGFVTRAQCGELVTEVKWNERGQVQQEITGDTTHEFSYDDAGRLTRMATGDRGVEYFWDADSRLAGFTDWNGGRHTLEFIGETGYAATGSNGVRQVTRLNPGGKVAGIDVVGGKQLFSLACSYDAEARLSTSRDSIFGDRAYSYDAAGRLLYADANSGARREYFRYDRAGNLIEIKGRAATLDAANQLLGVGDETLSYDGRGNLTGRTTPSGTWEFRYNARNQMVGAMSPEGVAAVYAYDAFGRRIVKRTASMETRFVWAGELLVAEISKDLKGGEVWRQDYLYHPETHAPLATCVDGKVYSYHNDHLGTPRVLTGPDGTIAWLADLAAFGSATVVYEQVRNPLRFAGQYFDAETGLHYNRFRYYSPEWGRYITRDPLGFAADTNFYRYAANDPVNQTDRFGLFGWADVGVIAASVAVAAAVVILAPVAAPVALVLAAAAAGAVAGGLNQALNEKQFCLPCILKAAGLGALAGAASALPFLLLPEAAGVGLFAAAGGAGGGISYLVNCIDGQEPNPSLKGFAASVAVGAVISSVAKGIDEVLPGKAVEEATDSLSDGSIGDAKTRPPDSGKPDVAAGKAAGVEPAPGSLTDIQARDWYNEKISRINDVEQQMRDDGASSQEIFEKTTQMRNEAKMQARELMQNQGLAQSLPPPKTPAQVLQKYNGDYEEAIAAAKRTNPDVNQQIENRRATGEQ